METRISPDMNRRKFLGAAAAALFAGVAIQIIGCDDAGTGPGSTSGNKTATSISGNHGHVAVVTAAQLTAGNGITINIQGSADHNHTLTLSGDQMAAIKAGTQVTQESSDNGHSHLVTFN